MYALEFIRGVAPGYLRVDESLLRTDPAESQSLLLVESTANGHRLMYIARLAVEASEAGRAVTLLLGKGVPDSPEYNEFLGPLIRGGVIRAPIHSSHDISPSLRSMMRIRRHCRRAGMLPVMLDGDRWLPYFMLAWSWRKPASILVMRPWDKDRPGPKARVKKVAAAALKKLTAVRVLQLIPANESPASMNGIYSSAVNDPLPPVTVVPQAEARQVLGLPQGKQILAVLGAIDERKSITHINDWMQQSAACENTILLLAGRCSENIRIYLARPRQRDRVSRGEIVAPDRFLSEEELGMAAVAADIILILHENEGSSGALGYAIAANRRTIAWGSSAVTEAVRASGQGIVAAGRDPSSLESALTDAGILTIPDGRSEGSTAPGRFAQQVLGMAMAAHD